MSFRSFCLFSLINLFFLSHAVCQVPEGSILWLKADQLVAGEKVARWIDQSGQGHDAVMNEVFNQPQAIEDGLTRALQFDWNQYLVLPSIFPTKRDYTIVAVVKLRDTTNANNILSGDHHAYWFDSRSTPTIAHDDHFQQKGISQIGVREGYNIVIGTYREETGQATHYVNGLFGDSLWIDSGTDSTLYVASYQRGYFSNANIAEILLYPRVLIEADRIALENTLFDKYQLSRPAPLPKPDSTFTSIPNDLQLYPRGADDSATVTIAGNIYQQGFDSVTVIHFRDSAEVLGYQSLYLNYGDGKAAFSFQERIRAELHDHDFEVHLKGKDFDSVIARRRRIVAGDVYLIGGASNGTFGPWEWTNDNPFCRTFGVNLSHDPKDTSWVVAGVDHWGLGSSVSGWGAQIQQEIAAKYGVPSAIINWGAAGTILVHHLKKPGNEHDLRTLYGRMLYRLDKSGLRNAVKAHFFWHGELNDPSGYASEFRAMYDSLKRDVPSIQKTYMMQLRPSYCSNIGNMPLREFQRLIQDTLKDVESIASTAFPEWDGCHFNDIGLRLVGKQLFRVIERDFYKAVDTSFLRSPTLRKAYYPAGKFDEIHLEFEPSNYRIIAQQDTDYLGIHASIRDYFFLDTSWGKIKAITTEGNHVILRLVEPFTASTISYVPDRYYHNSEIIYVGPWLITEANMGVLAFQDVPITIKSEVGLPKTEDLKLFPNPSSGAIRIAGGLDTTGPVSIELIDVNAKIALKVELFANTTSLYQSLDLSSVARGVYTVRVRTPHSIQLLKLVYVP
jgi:hypothetical protein